MNKVLQDATAIVGIGQTEFSKAAGRSETQLAAEAIVAALNDAGLAVSDVDGLVSYTIDPVDETELVRSLGIPQIDFSSRVPYGGGGSQGVILHAAAAIAGGGRRRSGGLSCGEGPVRRTLRPSRSLRRARNIVTFRFDGDAMVFPVRCPYPCIMDGTERGPLYALVRRDE